MDNDAPVVDVGAAPRREQGRQREPVGGRQPARAACTGPSLSGYRVRVPARSRRSPAARHGLAAVALAAALATAGCTATAAGGERPTPVTGETPAAADTVTLPDFDPASAVGAYAPGFPAELLPTPEGATLLATSAQPVPDSTPPTTQITLNLSSGLGAQEVLDQVGALIAGQGFAPVGTPALTGLTAQTAWTRQTATDTGTASEALLVGVLDDGERRLVSISGTVLAPPGS